MRLSAVSYTHLDVYKRQGIEGLGIGGNEKIDGCGQSHNDPLLFALKWCVKSISQMIPHFNYKM